METFPFMIDGSYFDEGDNLELFQAAGVADLPFAERLEFARQERENGRSWFYYLFDLGYFHERWSRISSLGWGFNSEDNGWYPLGEDCSLDLQEELVKLPQTEERADITPEAMEYLQKIIELTEAKDIRLILVTVPYLSMTEREAARCNTIGDLAEKRKIPYYNLIKSDAPEELDLRRADMLDEAHVRKSGAQAVSRYIGNRIKQIENMEV